MALRNRIILLKIITQVTYKKMTAAKQHLLTLGSGFRKFEVKLFTLINHKISCSFLDLFMRAMSFTASAIAAIVILFAILMRNTPDSLALFFYLSGSLLTGQIFVHAFKWLINRPRPCLALSGARAYRPLNNNNSFPSGHTCAAITMALVLSQSFPQAALILFILAAMTGVSRIYLGVHYPSDVLAGAGIGYFAFSVAPHICTPLFAFISSQNPV